MENSHFEDRVLNKLDELERGQRELLIAFAKLPHQYVPRSELDSVRENQIRARRWLVGNVIAWALALLSFSLTLIL